MKKLTGLLRPKGKTIGTKKGGANQRLVLCEYFSNGKKIKRWLKPQTVVEVPCTRCGYISYAYASDAQTNICMDCSADDRKRIR